MKFRDIEASDLPALPGLLSEGFPARGPAFWQNALDVLTKRQPVPSMPRYGVVMENDDDLCGVMLMIAQRRGEATYCNLSSWYVRDSERGFAPFMFWHTLKAKDVTFLDLSPNPHVVPIAEKFGFEPYTGGSLLLDLRSALRPGRSVRRLTPDRLKGCGGVDQDRITENLRQGCKGLLARDADGSAVPLLYRVARVKRHIPVARFVFGDPETILAHAGSIARHLLVRSIPLALVDWPIGTPVPFGRAMPKHFLRYKRGKDAPAIGDLLDTEYALFGI